MGLHIEALWVPASASPSGFRRLTAGMGLRSEGKMNSPLCTFLHQFLYSSSAVLFCKVSHLYTHKTKTILWAWTFLYLWRSQMWSIWKTPFLTACPAKWKIVAGRWLLMYLRIKKTEIRLWEPRLVSSWLNFPLEVPQTVCVWITQYTTIWEKGCVHLCILCWILHQGRMLMASQEICCKNQLIYKRL